MIFIVLLIWIIPFILYRKLYFFPISCVRISSDGFPSVISVKPTRRGFSQLKGDRRSCVASLGNGLFAYCVGFDEPDAAKRSFKSVFLLGDVYIFRRNRLGRFRGLDLSSRLLVDIIDRIN